jgi:GDP-4-dehydro-6-deoxy-D-mannose reductase
LAAQTFVPDATRDPLSTYETNALGTARLYEALRQLSARPPPRVLVASSGEVYGARDPAEQPLREDLPPRSATTYAASKVASEAIALASARTYGIPTIVTRAFNHIGPGQSERFAVASFARGLAAIAAGAKPVLEVGNLAARRDFLDVRDVVEAYVALAERGGAGEIYNVCSGTAVAIQEVLRQLIMTARVAVEVREDPARLRPSDVPLAYGDNAKLRAATSWEPRYTLAQSLRDVYADARARVATPS